MARAKAKAKKQDLKSRPDSRLDSKVKEKGGAKPKTKGQIKSMKSSVQVKTPQKSTKTVTLIEPAVPLAKAPKAPVKRKGSRLPLDDSQRKFGSLRIAQTRVGQADAICREIACEALATTAGYCRLHYIKNWKRIKRKEGILKEGKLNRYIEELVSKYPEKYIEAIRHDLANDREFAKVIRDLDLDQSVDDFDPEGETADVVLDNIKREFDDDEGADF